MHAQDSGLRRVDDRRRHQRAEDPAISNGERTALHLVDAQLAVASTLAEVDDSFLDVGNLHAVGITQHRYYQASVGGHCHTNILIAVINDVATVNGSIDIGETLECFGGRLDEETHETELGVM